MARHQAIDNQIQYLSILLDQGYDKELQKRYPEGKIFANSLLALSVLEYSDNKRNNKAQYAKIVDACVSRLLSTEAKQNFEPKMNPSYGMFYNAWCGFVLSEYLNSDLYQYSKQRKRVSRQDSIIQSRLNMALQDSIQIFDSYNGFAWPGDNTVGMISLKDDELRNNWLQTVFNASQNKEGLIHHIASSPKESRGSSSALISYCLNKMDYESAQEYFHLYQEYFVDHILGIQLVNENINVEGKRDIDSGPIFLGYGAVATIMNIKTAASFRNSGAKLSLAAFNCLGVPFNFLGRKFYLFKKEPMFDLFMLWASVEF